MNAQKPDGREPPVHVVLIDNRGVITDVQLQGRHGGRGSAAASPFAAGESYFEHCSDDAHRADVQALLKRKRSLISFVVPPPSPRVKRWFVVVGVPVGADVGTGAVLMHIDISNWVANSKSEGDAQNWQMPVQLNPALIQDTISKALVKQFGPSPSLASAPGQRTPHADVESLSPRQREVLLLVAAGKSNLEIAEELSCSLNTVKRHVTAVLQKLHLPNRTRAAMLANQLNLDARNFK